MSIPIYMRIEIVCTTRLSQFSSGILNLITYEIEFNTWRIKKYMSEYVKYFINNLAFIFSFTPLQLNTILQILNGHRKWSDPQKLDNI